MPIDVYVDDFINDTLKVQSYRYIVHHQVHQLVCDRERLLNVGQLATEEQLLLRLDKGGFALVIGSCNS